MAKSEDIGKPDGTRSDLVAFLAKQKQNFGYQSLSVVDENGTIISDDTELNGKNVADQEYFKKAMQGETYLSSTTYDINNKLCLLPVRRFPTATAIKELYWRRQIRKLIAIL